MNYKKIVITGGPCGGKSTAFRHVKPVLSEMGYTVLTIDEIATELTLSGVTKEVCRSVDDFQEFLMKLQIEKEKVYEKAAENMASAKVIIICDRGALDNKAYMTKAGFENALAELNTTESELCDGYDAVFHLVTSANGAVEYYSTANNSARTETAEEARQVDERLISAWSSHPCLKIIDNSTDYENKIERLIAEIKAVL